jgi:hypothetical protein
VGKPDTERVEAKKSVIPFQSFVEKKNSIPGKLLRAE